MKLTLFLIPIIFLSSCTVEKSTLYTLPPEKIQVQEKEPNKTPIQSNKKGFGSGFTLNQTDDETTLSYSGKIVKTWSHTPPEKVSFIWDEACTIVWKGFEKLSPEDQSTGKQGVWDALTEKEKKDCMKESFMQKITVKEISQSFFEIRELRYENYRSWLYDGKTGNIQDLPIQGQDIQISRTNSGITVFIKNNFDGDDVRMIYTADFAKVISKEEIPK